MKNTWKATIAAVVVLGGTQAARADVNLYGETGLFVNPTAEIAERGIPETQLNYVDANLYGQSAVGLGIAGQVAKGLELGTMSQKHSDKGAPSGYEGATWVHLGGKYQLVKPGDKGMSLALGLRYLDSNAESDRKGYGAYLAATKAFGDNAERASIKATVGLRYDHTSFKTSLDKHSSGKVNAFAGIEVPVAAGGKIKAIGEYSTKRSEFGSAPWAVGVRWSPKHKGAVVGLGYGNYGYDSDGFFAQVGYKFGR